ncbi:MAG: tetratricopeptide repeat protein [Roseivivax sp.]|nr:tetratricopeptide repeat protein [Roseivivax sp.]
MSDTDSFIDEVTEEVRRDKLFATFRKYGWIAVVAVLALVGGAAWREYQKVQADARSQAFGDAVLAALDKPAGAERVAALAAVEAPNVGGRAVLDMMEAAEQSSADNPTAAAELLSAIASNGEVPAIYRDIASFKALSLPGNGQSAEDRRIGLEALAIPGKPLRLLAEEQLALIEIEAGETAAAIDRLNAILVDSEVSAGLRRRAAQLIVALGGIPDAG